MRAWRWNQGTQNWVYEKWFENIKDCYILYNGKTTDNKYLPQEFVETLYADYLNNPDKLPEQWKFFFEGLNDKREKILENANGPSWSPKKKIKSPIADDYKDLDKKNGDLQDSVSGKDILGAAKDSVRANMLIRAYRIRGHLIWNLDPLRLQ